MQRKMKKILVTWKRNCKPDKRRSRIIPISHMRAEFTKVIHFQEHATNNNKIIALKHITNSLQISLGYEKNENKFPSKMKEKRRREKKRRDDRIKQQENRREEWRREEKSGEERRRVEKSRRDDRIKEREKRREHKRTEEKNRKEKRREEKEKTTADRNKEMSAFAELSEAFKLGNSRSKSTEVRDRD